ncbi:hypothetical protein BpHYR1_033590 [Brachionus plicatilis]|uniref:Uncharacterized protein n=1 Tax=Brachionus plicatilis TaxID=10195 RepID=A0A3M7RIG5_BRAPC|nr:hypothetical protein BpHYR1_033590 [Brachionus plicatilis]
MFKNHFCYTYCKILDEISQCFDNNIMKFAEILHRTHFFLNDVDNDSVKSLLFSFFSLSKIQLIR